MKNVIYIIAIFFWVLSMISKSKRQKQQAEDRKKARDINKPIPNRPQSALQKPAREVPKVFQQRERTETAIDYESAYSSGDYQSEVKSEEPAALPEVAKEYIFRSSVKVSSIGLESSEEKEAYDKDKALIPSLSLGNDTIRQYIIGAEILGKPKALRK
jgi:hypothetical protein